MRKCHGSAGEPGVCEMQEAANLTLKMAEDVTCEASEMLHAERV